MDIVDTIMGGIEEVTAKTVADFTIILKRGENTVDTIQTNFYNDSTI